MAALRFLYDCDPGADDALAMLLALGRRDAIEMIGVTCVAGNVGLAPCLNNARRILELVGRQDIPVYAGAARPIMASRGRVSIMHGSDGLAGSTLPPPVMELAGGHAANEISRIARAEGKLHICATGPLTNLALALILDPELPNFIEAITLMGGAAFCPGNTTPLGEFNFVVDPHAAAIVFEADIPITMLGLDVTRQALVSAEMIRRVQEIGTPIADEVAHLLINYGSKDPCLHDPSAIAWMLDRSIFTSVEAHVSILTEAGPAAGQVLAAVSERHLAGRQPNCTVVTGVDAQAFEDLFVEALHRYP
ncbi:nucleoside hydrolase [Paracoccus aminophilus]|uniref:Purine nucleosidase n=1 Tax=Paracoccus aminophilus JCM 7686 TaxID=1367847 RepID=S5XZR0_PARAH|nr:nucleoside hydrolase [Paracoccus aminophilus]AGT08930.1 purine nucleosidase [Paracoccus aminophilus JCM 7686]